MLKPLDEFYAHPQMADGHLNKCKECTKADVFNHRHGPKREQVLAYDRARAKQPHRVEQRSLITKRWFAEHPERKRAHRKLRQAILSGLIQRWPVCFMPDCNKKPEAHHPDYSDALAVVWLCPAHHKQAHALAAKLKVAA
jgi:hypothetical protein